MGFLLLYRVNRKKELKVTLFLRHYTRMILPFPAERKGLLANISEPNFQFRNRRTVLSNEVIDDYSQFMWYSSYYRAPMNLGLFNSQTEEIWRYNFASMLEREIFEGEIERSTVSGSGPVVLKFKPKTGELLSLAASSSLVKSLAGLDIYLETLAAPGDFIVIDEPEMNAHPDVQIAIAELLAVLVNSGIRVILTTHSPYITDHINNLVEAGKLSPKRREKIIEKLALKHPESVLNRSQVEIYKFRRDGVVESTYADKTESFDLTTFGQASDRLINLYSYILSERDDTYLEK